MRQKLPVAFVLSLFDTGLAAVRSLAREGIPVKGFDSDPRHVGFATRLAPTLLCPDPDREPEALLSFLLNEARQLDQPAVFISASDAFVLFLSRYREQLRPFFRFNLPPAPLMEALINKRSTYELAEKVGTPIPRTFFPESREEVEAIAPLLDYPAILKPLYGHLWRDSVNPLKAIKANSPQELIERYAEYAHSGQKLLAQSVILGPTTNIREVWAYFDPEGEPLGLFTSRKIRQCPPEFGVGSYVESHLDRDLLAVGLHFMRSIGYRGMGCVEFKRDERDGLYKLIELNPRLGQQNRLAGDCGVDFSLIQYFDIIGKPLAPRFHFKEAVCWLDATGDFDSVRNLGLSPKVWLPEWLGAQSYAKFAWDDLRPFLRASQWGKLYLRQLRGLLPRSSHPGWPQASKI